MEYSDQVYVKDATGIVAGLTLVAMVVIGFLVILFSSPTAMSFITSITGAKVAYAEDPSDGAGDSSGANGGPCGDNAGDCGPGGPPGDS